MHENWSVEGADDMGEAESRAVHDEPLEDEALTFDDDNGGASVEDVSQDQEEPYDDLSGERPDNLPVLYNPDLAGAGKSDVTQKQKPDDAPLYVTLSDDLSTVRFLDPGQRPPQGYGEPTPVLFNELDEYATSRPAQPGELKRAMEALTDRHKALVGGDEILEIEHVYVPTLREDEEMIRLAEVTGLDAIPREEAIQHLRHSPEDPDAQLAGNTGTDEEAEPQPATNAGEEDLNTTEEM